ncbi:MAG: L-threonine 3-dehydrogenase [Eubacteriales bacterium]|nr:L-threonine 3-dehydrogenase [Eubacteriales bacterium]
MKEKILVTGALGQIGTELVMLLRKLYGAERVVATDLERKDLPQVTEGGPFEILDVTDKQAMGELIAREKIGTVYHLAAILSAVGEHRPQLAWAVNMGGLYNALELAREQNFALFTPSSIACFGPSTPADQTPQETIQRPNTIYGVTKVAGELLCDYYHERFNVDTRGVRLPGLISHEALPGGGTTDYAVHIYYDAIKKNSYSSYIAAGTYMDMMYMDDALKAFVELMEADPAKLIHRNAFNIAAMSVDPEMIAESIRKFRPDFVLEYDVDPERQAIAESWPNSLDDSAARAEWGWSPDYDLDRMTETMLRELEKKLAK